jgi:hypothetical protein
MHNGVGARVAFYKDCQIFCVKGLLIVFLEKKNIKWGKA